MVVKNATNKALIFVMSDQYRLRIEPNDVTKVDSKYVSDLKADKHFKLLIEKGTLSIIKDYQPTKTEPKTEVKK